MLRGLYRSRCEQIGGIASAVRGLALDEVVDLILLAHEDEFVVAMHDQFLGAVLELLAWALSPPRSRRTCHVLVRPRCCGLPRTGACGP